MVASELPNASYRSGQARGQESRGFKRARRSTRGDRSAEPNGLSAIDVRRPRHIRLRKFGANRVHRVHIITADGPRG
jgi:hypothetical protein